jgi:calcineurin-like phosphoesterase family protein
MGAGKNRGGFRRKRKNLIIMAVFFTSDSHYNHKNICRGCSSWPDKTQCRDFELLQHMNDAIVNGINDVVESGDTLFHLGDYAFGDVKYYREFRSRINCNNIYLIYGNHDKEIITNNYDLQSLFTDVSFYREATVSGQKIIMSHYGFRVWNQSHRGSWMLYGHSHGSLEPSVSGHIINELLNKKKYDELRQLARGTHPVISANGKSMDVGIDTHPQFRPYSFDEIHEIMKNRKIEKVDDY